MDPELLTMSRMVRLLDDLDEAARARVVDWLNSRYRDRWPRADQRPPAAG